MENKKIEENSLIDRYLLGQLSEQETIQFQFQLIQDPELQAELAAQEVVMKTLWTPKAKAKPVRKLTQVRLVVVGLGVLIIGAAMFFFSNELKPTPKDPDAPTFNEPIHDVPKIDETSRKTHTIPLKEVEKRQTKPEKKADKQIQVPTAAPTVSPTYKSDETPAIATKFEPNPAWENYIGSHTRSNKIRITIEKPGPESSIDQVDGVFNFECFGKIKTIEKELQGNFKIYLFSNKPEDYYEFHPIKTWNLEPEKEASSYAFHLEESLDIAPGLYYYLLEEADAGIWYFVGKVSLTQSK